MLRLSSIFKPRLRPWMTLGSVVLVAVWLGLAGLDVPRRGEVPWMLLGISVPLIGALCLHLRNALLPGMVDEAWLDGDQLRLRRGRRAISIPLIQVAALDVAAGGLFTLHLCMPCLLGWRIRFVASRTSRGALDIELRRRIDDARRRGA